MRVEKIKDTRGWIAGAFDGALIRTDSFEVGYKSGKAQSVEPLHYHTRSLEHTFVIRGKCRVRSRDGGAICLQAGDMLTLQIGEVVAWDWETDWETLVIRTPLITNDKVDAYDA